MNIVNALYYNSVSPEKISDLIIDIILGFDDSNIRKTYFFDIFLLIPFYSYSPAQREFKSMRFNPNTSFQNKIERNPDIYTNIDIRYIKMIEFIKLGLTYAIQNDLVKMNEDLELEVVVKRKKQNNEIFNMAKVFSVKSTSYLYSFFKVDIDAI